eukprot:CAMPEP_0205830150 /NCGR_PEP_ID=MMETSP0206-20130828/40218_1 /ASSEMBLY_ACC=CAM_ASM_000279 /TAXON_ID=36767 /ORGANISM="Euplotes focardii, Strain TN1" /LENGTH=154 /DNA_ID=CAMNT_0053133527 /DNA_START=27 /DNA_END=491 /DNA_ORIENTATION=-
MRQALESEHVTRNLHNWIDLIFGDKQKGKKAFNANNLFYPMTYEENVKLDECSNEFEKNALEFQIQGFGQIPKQLFNESHPQSYTRKLLINQPSFKPSEGVEEALKKEVEELTEEMRKTKRKYEDNMNKQLKEFKVTIDNYALIDNKRKKKFER